jgi:prepilin-type N-terminal cleavage/methylation domain-containing protein
MKRGFTLVELLTVIFIIALLGGIFLQPLFEMRTFNKFNPGNKATYIDAMCSELRIVADADAEE